jgi:hypothetical protein
MPRPVDALRRRASFPRVTVRNASAKFTDTAWNVLKTRSLP